MNRSVRALAIALTLSLALNLFLLGFGLARGIRGWRGGGHGWFGPRGAPMGRVVDVLHAHAATLEPASREVGAARQAARTALEAEPFDPQALEGALERLRTGTNDLQVGFNRALVDEAKRMTPEQRRRLAEAPWFTRFDHPMR